MIFILLSLDGIHSFSVVVFLVQPCAKLTRNQMLFCHPSHKEANKGGTKNTPDWLPGRHMVDLVSSINIMDMFLKRGKKLTKCFITPHKTIPTCMVVFPSGVRFLAARGRATYRTSTRLIAAPAVVRWPLGDRRRPPPSTGCPSPGRVTSRNCLTALCPAATASVTPITCLPRTEGEAHFHVTIPRASASC